MLEMQCFLRRRGAFTRRSLAYALVGIASSEVLVIFDIKSVSEARKVRLVYSDRVRIMVESAANFFFLISNKILRGRCNIWWGWWMVFDIPYNINDIVNKAAVL